MNDTRETIWQGNDVRVTKNTSYDDDNGKLNKFVDYSVFIQRIIRFDYYDEEQALEVGKTMDKYFISGFGYISY